MHAPANDPEARRGLKEQRSSRAVARVAPAGDVPGQLQVWELVTTHRDQVGAAEEHVGGWSTERVFCRPDIVRPLVTSISVFAVGLHSSYATLTAFRASSSWLRAGTTLVEMGVRAGCMPAAR